MMGFGKWAMPAATLCLGIAIGQSPLVAPANAAGGVSPLDRLLVESEIRNKLALYTFYADGDGIGGRPRDVRKMADTLMTPDVISEIHLADGSAPIVRTGRAFVAASKPDADPARAAGRIAGRHYNVSTAFDLVTPTIVETRTDAVYFDATRTSAADCAKAGAAACAPQQPVKTVMWAYHMTWKKTPDGWQIAKNVLRDDN